LFRRVIWAIDPIDIDVVHERKVAQVIKQIVGPNLNVIQPVALLPPSQGWSIPRDSGVGDPASMMNDFALSLPKKVRLEGSAKLVYLHQNDLSLSGAIRRLVEFSDEAFAELIVVSSSAKGKTHPFLLGSFAESLILRSPIPVLLIPSSPKPARKIRRVLFPTDFSEASSSAVMQVLNLCLRMGAKLTIFHHLDAAPRSDLGNRFNLWMTKEREFREKQGEDFLLLAKESGVDAELIFKSDCSSVIESILRFQKTKISDMIALVSRSVPGITEEIGASTRQIVQSAPCPIWILHPVLGAQSRRP